METVKRLSNFHQKGALLWMKSAAVYLSLYLLFCLRCKHMLLRPFRAACDDIFGAIFFHELSVVPLSVLKCIATVIWLISVLMTTQFN